MLFPAEDGFHGFVIKKYMNGGGGVTSLGISSFLWLLCPFAKAIVPSASLRPWKNEMCLDSCRIASCCPAAQQ